MASFYLAPHPLENLPKKLHVPISFSKISFPGWLPMTNARLQEICTIERMLLSNVHSKKNYDMKRIPETECS